MQVQGQDSTKFIRCRGTPHQYPRVNQIQLAYLVFFRDRKDDGVNLVVVTQGPHEESSQIFAEYELPQRRARPLFRFLWVVECVGCGLWVVVWCGVAWCVCCTHESERQSKTISYSMARESVLSTSVYGKGVGIVDECVWEGSAHGKEGDLGSSNNGGDGGGA